MRRLVIVLVCALALSACALPPLIAVDAIVGEARGKQSYTGQFWQLACAKVGGQHDPATGDCANSFFQ